MHWQKSPSSLSDKNDFVKKMWSIKGHVLVAKIPSLIPQNALNCNFEFKAPITFKIFLWGIPQWKGGNLISGYAMWKLRSVSFNLSNIKFYFLLNFFFFYVKFCGGPCMWACQKKNESILNFELLYVRIPHLLHCLIPNLYWQELKVLKDPRPNRCRLMTLNVKALWSH